MKVKDEKNALITDKAIKNIRRYTVPINVNYFFHLLF